MNGEQKEIVQRARLELGYLGNTPLNGTTNALAFYLNETLKIVEAQQAEIERLQREADTVSGYDELEAGPYK